MKRLFAFFLAGALSVSLASGYAQGFPEAPPNLKEAQARGLQRLSGEELKTFFPGAILSRGTTGKHLMTYNADGTIDRKGFKDKAGRWRIDAAEDTYCNAFARKQGPEEACFAVFRAGDDVHHFDYDVRDGFYAHVWRRAQPE
ncbi:MAG: hypothetical protein MUC79_07370 [Thiobacillaceae bacterium]|nr:hypothetical protein [Thiobacillaceae bacterium]